MRHIHSLIIIAALVASSTWSWAQTRGAAGPSPADIEKAKQRFHSAEAHKEYGDELRARGNTTKAREAYSLAIKDYIAGYKLSKLRLFLYNLGSVYRLRGNQQWAIRCYQAFLDTQPENENDVKDAFTFIAELAQDLASGAKSAAADPSIDPTGVCVPGQVAAPPLEKQPSSSSNPWPDTWLDIVTNPPGARVYIEGKDVGPSGRAYAVSEGNYAVRVELKGYEPVEKTVKAKAAQITRLELALNKHVNAPPDTWLDIITNPPGARVYIDGKDVGPSGRAYAVTAGKYTVRVELDGYAPAEKTVDAVAAQTTRLELTLSKQIDTPSGSRRLAAWGLLGTGVGLTSAGVVNLMIHGPRFDDSGARLPEKYDSQTWGYALVASGVIAMGLSGYFFYRDATSPRTAPSPDTTAPEHDRGITLQRYRDGWGLGLSGRF